MGARMAAADPYAVVWEQHVVPGLAKTSTMPRRSAERSPANRIPKSLSTAYLMPGGFVAEGVTGSEGGLAWCTGTSTGMGTVPEAGQQQELHPPLSPLPPTPQTPAEAAVPGLGPGPGPVQLGTGPSFTGPTGAGPTGGVATPGALAALAGGMPATPSGSGTTALASTPSGAAAAAGSLPYAVRHPTIGHVGYGGGVAAGGGAGMRGVGGLGGGGGEADEGLQSWRSYVAAESRPAEKLPTADIVWGQTERERVYNFLLHVPYQLERLIGFGSLLLVDSFLGVFTLLPLRVLAALVQLCRGLIQRRGPGGPRPSTSAASRRTAAAVRISADGGVGAAAAAAPPPPAHASAAGTRSTPSASTASTSSAASGSQQPQQSLPHTPHAPHAPHGSAPAPAPVARLSGSQLYDMLCLAILCGAAVVLRAVRPGAIYYWLKDITSEFLKMSVLSTAFDMSDKILSNFGNDVLEALSGTCTQWLAGGGKKRAGHVAADAAVAGVVVTLHGLTLMCQALIVAVALNSSRNGLVALLIANNFVEIKSTVFKKWDSTRIWALVCADAVERFHLWVVLAFVVVEEMDSSSSWAPPPDYLRVCGLMLAAEVGIDVVKHAVLGKFNDVRPGIYREFHQELCTKALAAQSHSAPRLLFFHHLAPAALALRIATTLFWLRVETRAQVWQRVGVVSALWVAACGFKLLYGYGIKLLAHYFVSYYSRKYGNKHGGRPGPVARAAAGGVVAPPPVPLPAAAAAAAGGSGAAGAGVGGVSGPTGLSGGASVSAGGTAPTPGATPSAAAAAAAAASAGAVAGPPPPSPRNWFFGAGGGAAAPGSAAAATLAAATAAAAGGVSAAPVAAGLLGGGGAAASAALPAAPSLDVLLAQSQRPIGNPQAADGNPAGAAGATGAGPDGGGSTSGPAALQAAEALADSPPTPSPSAAAGAAAAAATAGATPAPLLAGHAVVPPAAPGGGHSLNGLAPVSPAGALTHTQSSLSLGGAVPHSSGPQAASTSAAMSSAAASLSQRRHSAVVMSSTATATAAAAPPPGVAGGGDAGGGSALLGSASVGAPATIATLLAALGGVGAGGAGGGVPDGHAKVE
ncbi:hypothetical protein CHLRE_02g091000v5 [Chlamydomonas reinhardtii]|uniref:Uncharacterized protein n=1 Tax=Chlamydomonas reinhardtii TaxID=3055 RepID=A0A2K3E187_CHLRE|nr:uncharacterized protein CHLRE_02g091000v5 [Chlamydomonas reinhardtii]PNW86543.1 hypothetical protein CHLRE_02g091000v5 [Chlamydomonas reinhardtii]